jgi:hypothetical protein
VDKQVKMVAYVVKIRKCGDEVSGKHERDLCGEPFGDGD